ncbi:MAG: T9SS type A sorting domain-containing protein [Cryomorphaceae bacterium]|nr:T9SS type A sorting domain-containing protein [Cryomorphaceae bacterium]
MKDIEVAIETSADSIASGDNSTLTANLIEKQALLTTFIGGNSQSGAMFDIYADESKVITGFSVNPVQTNASDIEIYYKTGTHVGFENTPTAWTSAGSYQNINVHFANRIVLDTAIPILAGQRLSFYITRTTAGSISYTNGTAVGDVMASANGLIVYQGVGISYPFNQIYSPRNINCVVHFEDHNPTGVDFDWSSGQQTNSIVVSPLSTTTYTATAEKDSCTFASDVTIYITDLSKDKFSHSYLKIYPNPAKDVVVIQPKKSFGSSTTITLRDNAGKVVYTSVEPLNNNDITIPVDQYARGIYILEIVGDNMRETKRMQLF